MKNSEQHIDRIDAYLNGGMTAEEKRAMEAEISNNAALAEEIEQHRSAHAMLDFMVAENLKKQLQSLEAGATVVPMRKKSRRMYNLAIAASVALLIGAFAILMPKGKSGMSLAQSNYEMPSLELRGGAQGPADIKSGLQALKNNDLQTAIADLSQVPNSSPSYVDAQYYLAHSYFNNKNYKQAEQIFGTLEGTTDPRYQETSEWFALLSCLAQNQTCEDRFEKILQKEGHSYNSNTLLIKKRLK